MGTRDPRPELYRDVRDAYKTLFLPVLTGENGDRKGLTTQCQYQAVRGDRTNTKL